jgi:acetoin utilization protein AcuC
MPPFSTWKEYEVVFDEIIEPIVREFEPDAIIRNGGSDPFWGDDLTCLGLDMQGLRTLGRRCRDLSKGSCNRHLDIIVSGYGNYTTLGWMALFSGVSGLDVELQDIALPSGPLTSSDYLEKIHERTEEMIAEGNEIWKKYWSLG